MDASERPRGQEHIPEYPKLWIWMRVFQLVVGLAVLFLSIHALEGFRFLQDLSIVMIVISVISVGLTIWLIVAQFSSPRAFRYWVTLALDFAIFVAWTVSGSILVSHTSALVAQRGVGHHVPPAPAPEHEEEQQHHPLHESHVSTFYAIAGLACLEFSLFCSSWIIDAVVIRRHRQIGLPSKPLKKRASLPVPAAVERTQTKQIVVPVSPPQKPRVKPTLAERVEMLFRGQKQEEAGVSEGVGFEGSEEGGHGGRGSRDGGDGV
ncbi:hypothetical protein BBK36DRAFT_1167524 [Trichoderma citrinoviride]|uniref:MARVEL domain-containing protein n=1 Tax=Trichoderma citrinoviride TaxID=58853 RepID=A0A2T4BG68_9HYPO|nr:hypothetical protein BBK36DRAFT_1167524 [Trichoderma citrinoviride]PTB68268.1 hypothetical protein BBK36DRAFT_1167524 [Trichoderma citrinoviride]